MQRRNGSDSLADGASWGARDAHTTTASFAISIGLSSQRLQSDLRCRMDSQMSQKKLPVVAAILLLLAVWIVLATLSPTMPSRNQQVTTMTVPDAGTIIIGGRIRRSAATPTLFNRTWATIRRWCGYDQAMKVLPLIAIIVEEETLFPAEPSLAECQ